MFSSRKSVRAQILMIAVGISLLTMGSGRAKADFVFGEPVNLGAIVNSSSNDGLPCLSADGLSLFFASLRSGGLGGWDIWVARRATIDDDWGAPVNLGPNVNSSADDSAPSISTDGLSLFFHSERSGSVDIWVTTRVTADNPWDAPVKLGPTVNTSSWDGVPCISADDLELYFASDRNGRWDLWITTRQTVADPWGTPANLGAAVNSPNVDGMPTVSPDGRVLMFQSFRPGGYGMGDIWMTRRATTDDDWSTSVNLGPPVNTSDHDLSPDISFDGATLYFSSWTSGGFGGNDLWQAPIIPVVDFNGDELVDVADIDIMIDCWGTDDSWCDIGPMPWGDGVVDVEDLIVLVEHIVGARTDADSVGEGE